MFYKCAISVISRMKLYTVCNSDLLSDLESGRHGAKLSSTDMRVCCPAYADDIALVAIHTCMPAWSQALQYRHESMLSSIC